MIVKNESAIIKRCLDAAKFCFDVVSIVDTGSTDNTVAVIETWLKDNKVRGKVHYEPWKNFGYNRTIAYRKAKEAFPEITWMLLLDADMCLVNKGFNKDQLAKADAFQISQTEHSTTYRNVRLIKAALNWRSIGVTHEYTAADNAKIDNLDTLWIDDRSDGGAKDDKLERDAALLIQGLRDEPDNSRYMFYLANTFFSLNQFMDAIYWYEKRIADASNKFEEECWYAYYRIAQAYEHMKDYPNAVYWYYKSINRRPHRIESYVRLAKMLTFVDSEIQYYIASMIIKQGLAMARPEIDVLFVEDVMYDYEPWFVLSIVSFYINKHHEGKAACIKVLQSTKAPMQIKMLTQANMEKFYKNI